MGFGRRRNYKRDERRNDQYNGYKNKRKLKTPIRLMGIIILVLGFLISLSDSKNHDNQNVIVSVGLVVIGMGMILQKEGLKKLWIKIREPPPCNCCKCTNCDRNHNHWTHD